MRIGPAFLQTFAVQLFQTVASIAAGIVIARGLGPVGQGQYAVLVAAVGLVSTIAAAGQFEGNVLTSAGQQTHGRVLLVRSTIQALLAGLLVTLTMSLWRSAALLREYSLTGLLSLIVVGEVLALLFRGINLGQHQITAYNLSTLMQRLGYLLILSIVAVGAGLRLQTVLEGWLAAVAFNVFVTGVGIWRRGRTLPLSWRTLGTGWIPSLTRGIRALVTICLTLVLVRTDVYMLGRMLGAAAVGQISVATTFAEYMWYIPSILANVLFAVAAAGRGPETVDRICQATRTIAGLLVPAALVLLVVGRSLIPLIYGVAYARAGLLFVLLVPGMLAIALHLVLDSYFTGSGFPPITYLAAGGALLTKVALNLLVVPLFGLEGAAAATSVVYILLLTTKVVAFTRLTHASVRQVLVPTWTDVLKGVGALRNWLFRFRGPIETSRA